MTTDVEKKLQAKLRGTQGALKFARNAAAKANERLRAIYAIAGLPENASFDTLVSVLRGKGEQSSDRLADNEELRLLLKTICAALSLPEEATKKDIVDALVALSDYGLAGKLLAESVSQAWAGRPIEQITTKELLSNLSALQRFRDKLNALFDVQEPISYDALYAKIEAACGQPSFGHAAKFADELCAVLSLPEGTAIPAIVATVKGMRERAAEPTTMLDELREALHADSDENVVDRAREVLHVSRLNRDAADAADSELFAARKRLEQVEQDLRGSTQLLTKVAALGSVLGSLCDAALAHVEEPKKEATD
jgi:hypothetical protein